MNFLRRVRLIMVVVSAILAIGLPAPAQQIFDAWLNPSSLAEWMRPCSATPKRSDVKVDAREGGFR